MHSCSVSKRKAQDTAKSESHATGPEMLSAKDLTLQCVKFEKRPRGSISTDIGQSHRAAVGRGGQ